MSFEVTDLPANETAGKSLSELDSNVKKLILKSDEELASHPWCKVNDSMYIIFLIWFMIFI